ncbi:hypothetical protein BO71DRAFT_221153 [Aspergillus ellipticus CBS 707.79]|uniref:Uncharacterized protein n=1 Tax=Aspergillus ellipticus CBS 707.79 TaxID=1448320 RepID=A0A319DBP1_9EURO|nr:hypothetical protein BO71DRAFT_221153 [Aspergillus ellipticus CBS 707.79]
MLRILRSLKIYLEWDLPVGAWLVLRSASPLPRRQKYVRRVDASVSREGVPNSYGAGICWLDVHLSGARFPMVPGLPDSFISLFALHTEPLRPNSRRHRSSSPPRANQKPQPPNSVSRIHLGGGMVGRKLDGSTNLICLGPGTTQPPRCIRWVRSSYPWTDTPAYLIHLDAFWTS